MTTGSTRGPCPCGSKCPGTAANDGEPRRCRLAYESKTFPPQFEEIVSLGPLAKAGIFLSRYFFVFLVYECPVCRCEVLYRYENPPMWQEMLGKSGEIELIAERPRC